MESFHRIICEHFKLRPEEVADSLTSKDIPEWDSMNYLLFIADLEKEFSISFTMDEVLGVQSLGDIRKLLEGKEAPL